MRSPYTIVPDGLRLAREYLELLFIDSTSDSTSDPSVPAVFVSIDFENGSQFLDSGPSIPIQLGVATLDTRDLSTVHPKDIISTFNFVTGPSQSRYFNSAAIKFLFGETNQISYLDIVPKIKSYIPETRPIILVGHDIANDLRVLQHLHFDLPKSVIGIVDTMAITSQVFSSKLRWSLRTVLEELGCAHNNLHSAGNDAHFTLRCLLLLVSRSVAVGSLPKHQQRLKKLEEIGHSEIPTKELPPTKAEKKKLKRLGRSRKHQAKTWDLETQERIRSERALKKRGEALSDLSQDRLHQ